MNENNEDYLFDSITMDLYNSNSSTENVSVIPSRPSVLMEPKKQKYRNYYNSKWANLKFFLQDKASLEASVHLLKTKTVEQFSTKCCEIYRKKIEIQLAAEKNRSLIQQKIDDSSVYESILQEIEISENISELITEEVSPFLFAFRENNHLMLKLIDNIDTRNIVILVPFLCHFFYENFYMESTEQEEIIYIVYLLLEKEIDKLIVPCEHSFLDSGFLAEFLKEIGSRYEIKNYINIILNDLINFLEESNSNFYSLDLNDDIPNKLYKDNNMPSALKASVKVEFNTTFKGEQKPVPNKVFLKRSTATLGMKNNNIQLLDFLPIDCKFKLSENDLLELYYKEKNEVIKQFLIKHIKKAKSEKNPYLYDCSFISEFLRKMREKLPQESASDYKKGFDIITKFINDLLHGLENDTIVPYSVKVICKFIYILIQQKFKSISRLDLNNFVCRFLFDKLIFPCLTNPERSDAGKNRLISLSTRKNLINIYLILKNLVKGELFNSEKQPNLIIFNKFILENYHKINEIINKIIDVNLPYKLEKLSKKFYSSDNFVLDNSKRSQEDINYEYFKENPNDFMQHKSICFTINEFNLFYNTVEDHKDIFLPWNKKFDHAYETISNFISMMKKKPNKYYVINSYKYSEEALELLSHKEKTKPLGAAATNEEKIQNLNYCISYLIGNLDILPHWDWVTENYPTMETFEYINQYLNSYEGIYNIYSSSIPLNWYSLYIINNLNNISDYYKINDYKNLYEEIENKTMAQHKKLSKLNEFLTVNMTTKFLLIDNKIKIFEEELKNVNRSFINVRTVQLMDSLDLKVYLANIEELLASGVQIEDLENIKSHKNLYVQKEEKNNNKKKDEIPQQFLCSNINHFLHQLKNYSKQFYEELKNISLDEKSNKKKSNTPESLSRIVETNIKNIIDEYLEYAFKAFSDTGIFKDKSIVSVKKNDDINFGEDSNNNELEVINIQGEEIAKHSLMNYILKNLCIKLISTENSFNEDIEFRKKCIELKDITFEDLNIPEEIKDDSILEKILSHIKKMDDVRTPEEMLNEFELAVQLINSLFIFMMDNKGAGADNLLPAIIYCVIKAKPKRMLFNIKFINYFFNEKDKLGKRYCYVIQALSSFDFIMQKSKQDICKKENENKKKK